MVEAEQPATVFGNLGAIRHAIEHKLRETLATDGSKIPNFIEESMRFRPVTQFVALRIPDEDAIIDDLLFPARRRIILNLEAAARDPEAFPDPDSFDIERAGLTRSRLPFGWGRTSASGRPCPGRQWLWPSRR